MIAYLMFAVLVGLLCWVMVLDDARWCPKDAGLAVAVLCGVLWPLVIAAAIVLGLLLVTCAIVRSFAALLRAVRPPPPSVPRAAARMRGCD